MRITGFAGDLLTLVPFLLVAMAALGAILWFVAGGRGGFWSKLTAWVGLVTLTLWIGSGVAFAGLHLLLFAVSEEAAFAGLIATTVFMCVMPFAWALVVARRPAQPRPRT